MARGPLEVVGIQEERGVDVEAAFLYPWVLVLREGGWPLFWAVMVFMALILIGLVYIWRKGGLELDPRARASRGISAE